MSVLEASGGEMGTSNDAGEEASGFEGPPPCGAPPWALLVVAGYLRIMVCSVVTNKHME